MWLKANVSELFVPTVLHVMNCPLFTDTADVQQKRITLYIKGLHVNSSLSHLNSNQSSRETEPFRV